LNRTPKTNAGSIRKPGFFWQGLLIVLPAVVLGSLGLFLLRQDRLLAEREAADEARKIARGLTHGPLSNALVLDLPSREAIQRFRANPARPEDDPVVLCARQRLPSLACLVDITTDLLYPPPLLSTPAPRPLDETELKPGQREDWAALNQSPALSNDVEMAIVAGERFLAHAQADHFAAAASYRLGVLRLRQGQTDRARKWFETVAGQYPEAISETGHPLQIYAQLQLLRMAQEGPWPPAQKEPLMLALCAGAVLRPSVHSGFVLRQVAAVQKERPASVEGWERVWQVHEMARAMQAKFQMAMTAEGANHADALGARWLDLSSGPSRLVIPQPGEGGCWLVALSQEQVRQIVRGVVAATVLPAYLGLSVEVAGRPVSPEAGGREILASSTASLRGNEAADLRVNVHLAAPARLYARQRTRTVWFGALIVLSVVVVVIGFVAAWRAFRRQQQLGEMRSNFVSSVSHELRAPIASIRLMSEELEDLDGPAQSKTREYHRFIKQECGRLGALIENVLDFSRHEQGRKQYQFEPTDLVALVQETAKLMQAYAAGRRIQVSPVVQGQPVEVEADGRALQQVLVNLIDNAIKHSPDGAGITVGLDFNTGSAAGTAGASPPAARHIRLFVEDHGEGIPAEEHERIFDRFYRRGSELRRETQGVGLGLTIVKYITEAHGGTITVRSAPGQGARFTVVLPVLSHHKESA
jgi:signal transduction histidine kinase